MSSNPAQERSGDQETACAETNQKNKTDQRYKGKQECDQTGSEQQGGSDQGDKESDSEEGHERDQTGGKKKSKCSEKKGTQSEHSGDSEEEVEAGTRQEVQKSKNVSQCQDRSIGRKSESNIKRERDSELETNQMLPAEMRVGLLNVRSMRNKTSKILNIITQNNLDVFATTETWLQQDDADKILKEASPQNFSFYYEVRKGKKGGGVAIQFSPTLQGKHIGFTFITTFEYVASLLKLNAWAAPVPFINVYYPPGYNKEEFRAFLNEFEMLLKAVFKNSSSIIVTGDFNIWVDPKKRSFTDEFYFLLLINDLVQHVKVPTHEKGHILDLVITRNAEISHLFVRDDGVSDHFTVYFSARPKDSREKTEDKVDQDEQAKQIRKKEE